MKVGIAGASGFTGAELLRLCAGHPQLEVVVAGADTQAGQRVGALYPSLAAAYPELSFTSAGADDLDGLDVAFMALPHGASQHLVTQVVGRVGLIVDLSADFRLRDPGAYRRWYGHEHEAPGLLEKFAYGLPELFGDVLPGAELVAAPGCYPTAAALALAPLVRAGLVTPQGMVVDAASGVSGAGRAPRADTHFNTVDEDFTAYGLLSHRHTPEMEQAIGGEVLFTPHLAPMNRGILATCYARPAAEVSTADVLGALADAYSGRPFVVVSDVAPSTKATLGSNCAHVTAMVDERTGWVLSLCALDNLGKGASGQAVQCANLALGLSETEGLSVAGVYP
ncbi:MAG TPA: N-acetyl-gamma-glutamyl-phosphate reductase [Acidimicrobiales bacterium]|nr:N-acetyl-gamma-glutamyl-phosphate reductase [Acidimicrobiales bacterium]